MAVIKELIRQEADGTLSFGNYELPEKKKLADFPFEGDLYKVKTFKEITRLEKNGIAVYESDPGTVVTGMKADDKGISFTVEGLEDSSVILGLEAEQEYKISIDGHEHGQTKTNLGGKLFLTVELNPGQPVQVKAEKM